MPGDPAHRGGDFSDVEAKALRDAEALAEGGVSAIIIENFGSAPFAKGDRSDPLPPHQVSALALIARSCTQRFSLPIGINCLRNDAIAALGIAATVPAQFVRVNVHTGAYVTDQGLIEGDAARTLRYRRALGIDHVAILADILVKHATPLAPLDPETATRDCLARGMADGVIVTGDGTGAPVDPSLLERVRAAAGTRPVWIGSGMTPERAPIIAPFANGAIVGTWLKHDGVLSAPVDPARVREMAAVLRDTLRPSGT